MYENILDNTYHRNSPLPNGHWLMTQEWTDLLFIHVPVSREIISQLLPEELKIDSFNQQSWITIIPFKVSDMRFRQIPPLPYLHRYLELNVRTYVKREGIPGIYFFSLDADKLLPVLGARLATLPYFYARMKMKKIEESCYFESDRRGKTKAEFKGSYQPFSKQYSPSKGSLEHWLLERYYLFSKRNGSIYKVGIHHNKWKVQDAKANVEMTSMLSFLPEDEVKEAAFMHYAKSKRVLFWPLQKVKK